MPDPHLVVVPHTHWDREWHETFEAFRQRLVPLVDGLLDLLESDPEFRHFTLDGQAIVVDDYLEVRPEARERLVRLVEDGRLLVGPWYVLPDEWLVSGEALIRNLRLGIERSKGLGAVMPLGYVPDQFGHVGQLPQIFAGFGFEAAVLWRGVGADVEHTLFDWEAPDGTRLLTVYMPFGYGNAALLPMEPEALVKRLDQIVEGLAPFSEIPTLLGMNGSDHRPPQPGLPTALREAVERRGGLSAEIGTLPGFVARARGEQRGARVVHRGELRSGLRAPLLPGCASSRMAQKRRDFRIDSLLTRYLEPLSAWLGRLGGPVDRGGIRHAWRRALENHPHDSICGCSTDAVHAEVETRLAATETVVAVQLERASRALFERVAVPEEAFGPGSGESLVVWNPNPTGCVQIDDCLEADLPLRARRVAPFHLRDARGRRLSAHADLLDPGELVLDWRLPAEVAENLLPGLGAEVGGGHVRSARLRRRGRRIGLEFLVASTPSGFDPGPLHRELRALLAEKAIEQVKVTARRLPRLRLRCVDALPGWGLRVYRLAAGASGEVGGPSGQRMDDGRVVMANEALRVTVQPDGRVDLEELESGVRVEDLLRLVSEADRGDEYNFDPAAGAERVERPERVRLHLEGPHESEVAVRIEARYALPRSLAPDRRSRSRSRVSLPVSLRLRLTRGLPCLALEVELDNGARDHRLRLHLRSPFGAERFLVESAFEVAERPIAPAADGFGSASPAEYPIGAVPQRSFAALEGEGRGFCVANRGGGEVEALREADGSSSLALTLLRAVGWLSRDDLDLRPGHAGPPLATPGAQVPGRHRLAFSLWLDAAGDPARSVVAQRFAHPPLARCGGGSADAGLADGDRLLEVEDAALPISALEAREGGAVLLRLYNPTPERRETRLSLPSGAREARQVDLAERELAALPVESGACVALCIEAGQILSLLLR